MQSLNGGRPGCREKAQALHRFGRQTGGGPAEIGSSELLESINGFYADIVQLGQALGAVRRDVPQELLVALVRDMALTFDRWFIGARATPVETRAQEVTPASAARAFSEIAQRLCQPA